MKYLEIGILCLLVAVGLFFGGCNMSYNWYCEAITMEETNGRT